ncbi:MAG: iron ABC transporter permease [Hyphomonadaceae bacterium]
MTLAATPARTRAPRLDGVTVAAALATLVCATPAIAVIALALISDGGAEFGGALIREGAMGTFGLVLAGGTGAIVFGATTAWLVTLCRFPGRGIFEWLLVVPLAAPSYILAYAYASMTWAGGAAVPVQGFGGAAFIYAIGLYPYVYLAARAAFASQSVCALEAARMLGASPLRVFWQVALPLARPGIAAGGALACMEIAADYGAAQHFGLSTLSTAVFRAWYAHGSPGLALQISAVLLVAAMVFLLVERGARGRAAYSGGSARWRPLPRYQLNAVAGALAAVFCGALIVFGALLPLMWLARLALLHANVQDIVQPFVNSLALSASGAAITLGLAAAIAVAARRATTPLGKSPLFAAGMGYAAPGAVIALGALSLFGLAREAGLVGGLGAALSLAALFWTYAARFASAGVGPIDAGLARLSTGLDASARTLGAGPWRRFAEIDLPIAAPSLAAAALILFVEILKELPATLILRPFNFDTLAVKAYSYASDERLLEAAAPSLLIFLAGIAPIIILARSIGRGRAGVTS